MDFALSEEQRLLQSTAREFFARHAGTAAARTALGGGDPVPDLRPELAEIGFLGLLAAEEHGGSGGTVLDLAVVAEQAGRTLAPAPLTGTAARAVILLQAAAAHGSEPAGELLARVLAGETAVAVADAAGPLQDSGGGLTGELHPVLDGASAQVLLVRAPQGLAAVAAGPALTLTPGEPIDPTRGLARGRLQAAPASVLLSGESLDAVWNRARDVAAVIRAAEDLGTVGAAVAMAVQYAKDRVAFGRPIGSYQAVKHMLVDAYVLEEQLRSLVWLAAWTADEDPDTLALYASAAASYAADAVERATETLIQVHGGIGFTWEHDAHLYWRRAKVDRLLLGDAYEHRDRVARLLLEQSGARLEERTP